MSLNTPYKAPSASQTLRQGKHPRITTQTCQELTPEEAREILEMLATLQAE